MPGRRSRRRSPRRESPRCVGVAEGDVRVIPYPLGRAIKIVMPRRVTSRDPGDTDAYGAQQHGPLLESSCDRFAS